MLLTNPLWVANTRMKMEGVAELRSRADERRPAREQPQPRRYASLAGETPTVLLRLSMCSCGNRHSTVWLPL